jgi:hypothetical protein
MSKKNDNFLMKGFTFILEKGFSPIPIFASISFTIKEKKTHNP